MLLLFDVRIIRRAVGKIEFLMLKEVVHTVACRPIARQRQRTIQQPLRNNGSANKHIATATAVQQSSGALYAVRAEAL